MPTGYTLAEKSKKLRIFTKKYAKYFVGIKKNINFAANMRYTMSESGRKIAAAIFTYPLQS